jgi:hypothetical protein
MNRTLTVPLPRSMTQGEAASWYRALIPHIESLRIDGYSGDNDHEVAVNLLKAHWATKSRLRLAAAQALIDQELVGEFLQKFELPSADAHIGLAFVAGGPGIAEDPQLVLAFALRILTTVTDRERGLFGGTIGESIGMECQTVDGTYVVTEDGWVRKN